MLICLPSRIAHATWRTARPLRRLSLALSAHRHAERWYRVRRLFALAVLVVQTRFCHVFAALQPSPPPVDSAVVQHRTRSLLFVVRFVADSAPAQAASGGAQATAHCGMHTARPHTIAALVQSPSRYRLRPPVHHRMHCLLVTSLALADSALAQTVSGGARDAVHHGMYAASPHRADTDVSPQWHSERCLLAAV